MGFEEVKNVITSRTVWGGILSVLASIALIFNIDISDVQGQLNPDELVEAILAVVGGVGGVVAIAGRIIARAKLVLSGS